MTNELWANIAICAVLAFAYAYIVSKKSKKAMNSKQYCAILICVLIAVAASVLGKMQTYIGSPMIGLFIGMLIVNLFSDFGSEFKEGTTFAGKKYLSLGIVLAGATLNFADVMAAARALPLVTVNIFVAFGTAYFVGKKLLSVSQNTCTLVGGGTCICGGTAIATLSSIIKAKEDEIAYAMTAIFLFDIFAALTYPYLAEYLGLSATQFGYLAGTAINDTSSVAAAQETYALLQGLSDYSLPVAVKLVRTTMLIVVAIVFTMLTVKKEAAIAEADNRNTEIHIGAVIKKVFPWFILYFLIMAILNTLGVFSQIPNASSFFKNAYKFFVTLALAGVGFKIQFKDLFTKGVKPIILGGCTWAAVAATSIVFILLFQNI